MPSVTFSPPFTKGVVYDRELYSPSGDLLEVCEEFCMPNDVLRARGHIHLGKSMSSVSTALAESYCITVDETVTHLCSHALVASSNYPAFQRMVRDNDTWGSLTTMTLTELGGISISEDAHQIHYSPRTTYLGHVVMCGQDGVKPTILVSGAELGSGVDPTTVSSVANSSRIQATTGNYSGTIDGWYAHTSAHIASSGQQPVITPRIVEAGSTYLGLQNCRHDNAVTLNAHAARAYGFIYPSVSVYNEGTIGIDSSGNVTLKGGDWDGTWGSINTIFDSLLYQDGTTWKHRDITDKFSPTSTTCAIGTSTTSVSDGAIYQINRCPAFTDAAVFKGGLWGIGVAQHPNRLYWMRPGADPTLPPGFSLPHDQSVSYDSPDITDFELQYKDIPGPSSGDTAVALLPTIDALLFITQSSCYAIYGDQSANEWSLVDPQAGCIHRQSAVATEYGVFWAGRHGVYTFDGSGVIDITQNGFTNKWKEVVKNNLNSVIQGMVSIYAKDYHLFLTVFRDGGGINSTFVHDLRTGRWIGEFFTSGDSPIAYLLHHSNTSRNYFAWTHYRDGDIYNCDDIILQQAADTTTDTESYSPNLTTTMGLLGDNKDIFDEVLVEDVEVSLVLTDDGIGGPVPNVDVYLRWTEPLNYYYESGTANEVGGPAPTPADPHSLQGIGSESEETTGTIQEKKLGTIVGTRPTFSAEAPVVWHFRDVGIRARQIGLRFEWATATRAREYELHAVRINYSNSANFS